MAKVKCPHCFHVNPERQENCQQCNTPLPRIRMEERPVPQPGKSQLQFHRGQVVAGRYTVLNLIGQGGMGCIYKVHDNTLGEDVALKTLLPQFLEDKVVLERFYNEAKIARRLAHPNIVRVHDIGEDGKILYISMEYLQGMSLREMLESLRPGERLPIAQTLRVFDQLCAALEYAHQFTIHRDIKPENVMLGQDGNVRLMDFGISKLMANTRLTHASVVMGTPFYMSPEQIRNSRDVDARADIYSVGVMLYEILTGTIPTGVPKPASQVTSDVPPAMDRIVAKCVDPDPRERYQNASELREAFLPIRRHIESGVSRSKTSLIRPSGGSAYSVRKIAGAFMIVAIVVVALWGIAGSETRRKVLIAEAAVPAPDTAVTGVRRPTLEQYGAIMGELEARAKAVAAPADGLNDAINLGEKFWKQAQEANEQDEAIRLAGYALQCFLAPLMQRNGMVFVPPGRVSPRQSDSAGDIPGFLIDSHEVTLAEFQAFVKEEPRFAVPAEFVDGDARWSEFPITNITCIDAFAFAAWSNADLPTEAQWARAAYGDDNESFYPWEGEPSPEDCNAWFNENGYAPSKVGAYPNDVSRFGCFDMVGNASEWTRTTTPPLPDDAVPALDAAMITRGGNFAEAPQPWTLQQQVPAAEQALWLGFRCVVNIPTDPAFARAVLDRTGDY